MGNRSPDTPLSRDVTRLTWLAAGALASADEILLLNYGPVAQSCCPFIPWPDESRLPMSSGIVVSVLYQGRAQWRDTASILPHRT